MTYISKTKNTSMLELTRYSSFENLKSDSMTTRNKKDGLAKDLKDFEHFLVYLRQSSTLKKGKAKQSAVTNE